MVADEERTWCAEGGDVAARVRMLAGARAHAVLLQVEIALDSLLEQRRRLGPDQGRENQLFRSAWELIVSRLPASTVGRRSTWTRFEFVLEGDEEDLEQSGRELLAALEALPELAGLSWHVLLIAVCANEAERTLLCDPGYDVADQRGSFLAWVEPASRDEWPKSQSYPSFRVLDR